MVQEVLYNEFPQRRDELRKCKVLVVGDVMIDHHFYGKEAQPGSHHIHFGETAYEAEREVVMPGGAARVAANLAAFGCDVTCVSVVGAGEDDVGRAEVLRKLVSNKWGVKAEFIPSADRFTTLKTRFHQKSRSGPDFTMGVHREAAIRIPDDVEAQIVKRLDPLVQRADAVLVADFDKGLVTAGIAEEIGKLTSQYEVPLVVDPKNDWTKYKGMRIRAMIMDLQEFYNGALELPGRTELPQNEDEFKKDLEKAVERWPDIDAWVLTWSDGGPQVVWTKDTESWPKASRHQFNFTTNDRERIVGGGAAFTAGFVAGYATTRSILIATKYAYVAGEEQARGDSSALVTFEDLKGVSYLGPFKKLDGIRLGWEARAYEALAKLETQHCVHQVLPGIVDPMRKCGRVIESVKQFLTSADPQLLVVGPSASGKTTLVMAILTSSGIQPELVPPAEVTSGEFWARLDAFIRSDKKVLVIDELLKVEGDFRIYTSKLAQGKLSRPTGEELRLDKKKVIGIGSVAEDEVLTKDIRTRFAENILVIEPLAEPLEVIDVFAFGLLEERTKVSVDKQVLWSILTKAKHGPPDLRTIRTWSSRVSEKLNTAAKDAVTKELWEGCGYVVEKIPRQSVVGQSVAFTKNPMEGRTGS